MTMDSFNKTKIIATIGPATSQKEMIMALIDAGVSILRLNFSHGSHKSHQTVIETVRAINQEQNTNICLLQDLQGPKIRIGNVKEGMVLLKNGQKLVITPNDIVGSDQRISTNYHTLAHEVKIGDPILIDDGKIILKALHQVGNDLVTEVYHGGYLRSQKGLNLPSTQLSTPSLTEKDLYDLAFGLQHNIEWIALSFVRSAQDIIDLKARIQKANQFTKVIAKIEKPEALAHIEEIIAVADGIMVARGDLGVEIEMTKVPMVQKEIVMKSNSAGKPVIIATQMMESMMENPLPTRAETNDIANAVIDGADALMLSGETALGKYPIKVVTEMKKTILAVEEMAPLIYNKYQTVDPASSTFYNDNLIKVACRLSTDIAAKAIVCMTKTGWTALELAKHRPKANIFVFTDNQNLLNSINLVWNTRGYYYDSMVSTDQTFADIASFLKEQHHLTSGDCFISLASMPIASKQRTNMLKINIVE